MSALTRDETYRAHDAAWERYQDAKSDHASWARVIALNAARGWVCPQSSADYLLTSRAAELEARADWRYFSDLTRGVSS